MTFKVWDKVRCIDNIARKHVTVWRIYTVTNIDGNCISIVNDEWDYWYYYWEKFELVQEDKLPHELLWLDRYRVVKKDESDPLWSLFWSWYTKQCWKDESRKAIYEYYGYDDRKKYTNWFDFFDDLEEFRNNPTLITLQERDRCVNKKPTYDDYCDWVHEELEKSQTPKYSYQTQILRSDWLLFTKDKIWDELVSDIQARMNRDRSVLRKWKDLFDK